MNLLVIFCLITCNIVAEGMQICWTYENGKEDEHSLSTALGFPLEDTIEKETCKITEACDEKEDTENNNKYMVYLPTCPAHHPSRPVPPRLTKITKKKENKMLIVFVPVIKFVKASLQPNIQTTKEKDTNVLEGVEVSTFRFAQVHDDELIADSNGTAERMYITTESSEASFQIHAAQFDHPQMCLIEDDWSLTCPRDITNLLENKDDDLTLFQLITGFYIPHTNLDDNKCKAFLVQGPLNKNEENDVCPKISTEDFPKFTMFGWCNDTRHGSSGKSTFCSSEDRNTSIIPKKAAKRFQELTERDLWLTTSLVLLDLDTCSVNSAPTNIDGVCLINGQLNNTVERDFFLPRAFKRLPLKEQKHCVTLN